MTLFRPISFNKLGNPPGDEVCLIVNTDKIINISVLRATFLVGSFPFENRILQTRPESAFSFEVSEGREKP